jgi:Zn finger protein HypA/HybF involved in hydrogenase expression
MIITPLQVKRPMSQKLRIMCLECFFERTADIKPICCPKCGSKAIFAMPEHLIKNHDNNIDDPTRS